MTFENLRDTDGKSRTLYVFIDESGNFDFSPKGTRTFVLSALATFDPSYRREELVGLRYELLAGGHDHEFFHATEDRQYVRDKVFDFLGSIKDKCEVHAVAARKNRAHPTLHGETYVKNGKTINLNNGMGLYQLLCKNLLGYVFRGKSGKVDKIVVVLSSLYNGDKKKTILKEIKSYLKLHFQNIPFEIFSHQSSADLNCQLADYCCWAIYVRIERKEKRPITALGSMMKTFFDIFKSGSVEYYQYKENPDK